LWNETTYRPDQTRPDHGMMPTEGWWWRVWRSAGDFWLCVLLLLVGATDCSAAAHRLRTSGNSSGMQKASALCECFQDGSKHLVLHHDILRVHVSHIPVRDHILVCGQYINSKFQTYIRGLVMLSIQLLVLGLDWAGCVARVSNIYKSDLTLRSSE